MKKQFAIFWGQKAFSLVEANNLKITSSSFIPFDTPVESYKSQDIPESLRLTSLVQTAIRKQGISLKKVNLSLPTDDLIFRSFVIPWMLPDEVKNVVDFEATKYIPISLSDLSYAYHAISFTENNQKNIRILFVGIRRDILDRYIGILTHSTDLLPEHIEPAPVSITRLLERKGFVQKQGTVAIIGIGQISGEIIIVHNGIVHFVRRFAIPDFSSSDPSAINIQLFNDVRVSLNFYSRQFPPGKIDKIVVVTLRNLPNFSKDITSEFGTPATFLPATKILDIDNIPDMGLLYAYGAALIDKAYSTKDFDVSPHAEKIRKEGKLPSDDIKKYKTTASIFAVCFLAALLTVFVSNRMIISYNETLNNLRTQQASYDGTPTETIGEYKKERENKLQKYKSIRLESDIPYYLIKIPELLPPGVWLTAIDIKYQDQGPTQDMTQNSSPIFKRAITLSGYVYHENTNEQFRMINNLLTILKNDKHFVQNFTNFSRVSATQQMINQFPVTAFTIVCN